MPRSNLAFFADAFGTLLGGLLGSSPLTTYVESASAVREGGRTGFTAVVCSLFFFASCFMSPLFSQIPFIATGARRAVPRSAQRRRRDPSPLPQPLPPPPPLLPRRADTSPPC